MVRIRDYFEMMDERDKKYAEKEEMLPWNNARRGSDLVTTEECYDKLVDYFEDMNGTRGSHLYASAYCAKNYYLLQGELW